MENCTTCAHAIFDAQWGDYKCEVIKKTVYQVTKCMYYEEGKPTESKVNELYEEKFVD